MPGPVPVWSVFFMGFNNARNINFVDRESAINFSVEHKSRGIDSQVFENDVCIFQTGWCKYPPALLDLMGEGWK